MAWLAVNKNMSECIFKNKPKRFNNYIFVDEVYHSKEDVWGTKNFSHYSDIYLPKGSIKKLIGRELTWEDEPVEIKEE